MGKKLIHRNISSRIDIGEYFKKVKYISSNKQLSLVYGYGGGYQQDDYDDGLYGDSFMDYSKYTDIDDWVDNYYHNKSTYRNNEVDDYEDIKYRDDDYDNDDDSAIYEEKTIYYYVIEDNKLGKPYKIFHNLAEFDEFLNEEGLSVDEGDVYNYVFYDVIHCCIDPVKKSKGVNELISDLTLDGLEWSLDLFNVN